MCRAPETEQCRKQAPSPPCPLEADGLRRRRTSQEFSEKCGISSERTEEKARVTGVSTAPGNQGGLPWGSRDLEEWEVARCPGGRSSRGGTEDAAFKDKVRQGQLVCGDDQRMPGAEHTDPVGQGKNFDL